MTTWAAAPYSPLVRAPNAARPSSAQAARTFAVLRRVRLFDGVDDDALRMLADTAVCRTTAKGEHIMKRGAKGDALYVVLRGRFKVTATDRTGRKLTLSVLATADVFGEMALIDGQARSADVFSISSGAVLVIDRATFMALSATYTGIVWTLMSLVVRRLRRLTERIEDRAFLDLEHRLAKRLYEAAEDVGGSRDGRLMRGSSIAFTQQDLADIVDASRERVNRQLAAWSREGFVSVERRRIRLLEPDAIRGVYEGARASST